MRCTTRLAFGAEVNGNPLGWVVDTGATYSLLEESQSSRLHLTFIQKDRPELGSFLRKDVEGRAVGLRGIGLGTRRLRVVCLPSLSVGSQTWQQVQIGAADFKVSELGDGGNSTADLHGLFGSELLAAHGALIDCSSLVLWFQPDGAQRTGR